MKAGIGKKKINSEGKRKTGCGRKFAAAVFAAVLAISALTACGRGDGSGTKLVFTTGFGKDEIFRIGDESCKKSEIMVYLSNIQNQYESVYGVEIWDAALDGVTLEENVKETVLARIAQIKTMYLLAVAKGVSLDEEETQRVEQAAEEYFNSLSEREVELLGVSKDTITKMYREYAMADKVYEQIIQDINPEISDDEARTIKIQHIFFSTTVKDGAGNIISFSDEEKKAVYDKACQVRELAVDGIHEFTELAAQYSDDSNITRSFGKGEVDINLETAAFNLETDEVSQVVESSTGYHIIKCLSTFDREETDANKLEIVEQRRREVFGQEYNAFVDTLVRSLNEELWGDIALIHDEQMTTTDFFEVYEKYF